MLLTYSLREKCPNTELFLVLKVTIKNANFFVLIVSCLHTHQQKHFTLNNGKVFNTVVSHDFNMTSLSPCCHNWLTCICFCVCICLLSRIFCLACYRLCVEQSFSSPYFPVSDWIRTRKNSVFGHFLRSDFKPFLSNVPFWSLLNYVKKLQVFWYFQMEAGKGGQKETYIGKKKV